MSAPGHFGSLFPRLRPENADFWLFKEWEREFDQYIKNGNLPNLQFVRFAHDHFGDFGTAIAGVNTPETQMADNDYAIGLLLEKVSKSPYKDSTLIFIIEDDAQDGGDHVDAHRSPAYIVGPYVKQGAVVSAPSCHTIRHALSRSVCVQACKPQTIRDFPLP